MAKFLAALVVMLVVAAADSSAKPQERHFIILPDAHSAEATYFFPVANRKSMVPQPPAPPGLRTTESPECARASTGPGQDDPCTEDDDYNDNVKELVNNLIQRDSMLKELMKSPILSNILNDSPLPSPQPADGIQTRTRLVQESPVCSGQEIIIYPKRGKTAKSDWVFIVNQEGAEQALKVEKCINDGSPCSFGMPLQGSATATCRQKYVYRRLLTVGNNAIQPEEVLMPSCCVCYLRSNGFDITSRTKRPTGQSMTPAAPPVAPHTVSNTRKATANGAHPHVYRTGGNQRVSYRRAGIRTRRTKRNSQTLLT